MGTGLASKMTEALVIEEDDNNANVEECLICWALPQKYGISTECTHFFLRRVHTISFKNGYELW